MRLTQYHLEDLQAVQRGDIFLTSAGFEFDGLPVQEEQRDRLDALWMDDYIDADIRAAAESASAPLELTEKGRQALARADQESKR